jgi:Protein of unknown function (DUF1189)
MKRETQKLKSKSPAWKVILFSFFSREIYSEVAGRWSGTGFSFLFLFLVILSVPEAIRLQLVVSEYLPGVTAKIPDFKIANGEFSSSVAQPYRVDFSPTAALVIDTTGKINQLDLIPGIESLRTAVLVTKNQWQERRVSWGLSRDQIRNFASFPSLGVTREQVKSWTDFLVRWAGSLGYFFIVLFLFFFEVAALCVYGLLGLLFAKVLKRRLDYDQSLRLSVVSHVPALTLSAILPLTGLVDLPFWGTILISMGYLGFAVAGEKKS